MLATFNDLAVRSIELINLVGNRTRNELISPWKKSELLRLLLQNLDSGTERRICKEAINIPPVCILVFLLSCWFTKRREPAHKKEGESLARVQNTISTPSDDYTIYCNNCR